MILKAVPMATERTVTVRGKAAMGDLNAAIKQSGKVTREFNAELKKAALLQGQFEAAQKKAAAANAQVAGQMAKAKKSTEDARIATSKHAMMVGGGLVTAFAAAEYATLGFDKQMSAVGAASGATGQDLAALRDAAIAAGQATVFGAQDAARAEEELAKAGVSVKDVLSGGLIGSLNLATAGSLDLGRAAEIAASTMTQFKLAGKDIPHIADLLAAGAGKAQGSVEDLGLALKYVGPTAAQMGVSLEETTGTLAELASNGILADSAGTGLRGVLTALTGPSAKAAEVMKQLGINVYDSHHNFIGFRGVAEQLHRSLSGLTAQQRDAALAAISGASAVTGGILLAGGAYGTLVPKLRTARRELEATGKAGMTASKGIGLLGQLGGVAAALGALAIGAQYLGDKLDNIPDPAILAQHLQDLFIEVASGKSSVMELANAFAGASRLIDLGGVSAKIGARQMAVLDQQMGDFARGNVKAAQKVMVTLTDSLGAQGFTAEQVAGMFPQYAAAVKAATAQNDLAATSQDDMSGSIAGTSKEVVTYTSLMAGSVTSTDSLAESTKGLKDAVSQLNDEFDFYIGRHVDLIQADSDWRIALMDAEKQLKDSKGTLDDWTTAGEANVQLFGDLIKKAEGHREAMVKDGSSADEATAAFWRTTVLDHRLPVTLRL